MLVFVLFLEGYCEFMENIENRPLRFKTIRIMAEFQRAGNIPNIDPNFTAQPMIFLEDSDTISSVFVGIRQNM